MSLGRIWRSSSFILLIALGFLRPLGGLRAQIDLGGTQLGPKPLLEGLEVPWSLAWAGEDTIFFSELGGRVSRLDLNTLQRTTLLQIDELARENQSGLMGLEVDQNFPQSPYVYVAYTYYNPSNDIRIRIARFEYSADSLVNELILKDDLGSASSNTGCRLLVRGNDLWFTLGDVKDRDAPQDTSSNNGKIHRIHTDGSTPSDNPYGSSVWSMGHRNPQGLAFHDSLLLSSEHGAATNDELNWVKNGGNYGWPWVSGFWESSNQDTCDLFNIQEPLKAWSPTVAPAGIDVYRGTAIPEWKDHLLMACLKDQSLRVMSLNGATVVSEKTYLEGLIGRIRDVMVSPDGRVFICSTNEDAFGTPRLGGDKIFELTKDYVYDPPDFGGDTSLADFFLLDSTLVQTRILADHLYIPWDFHWGPDAWIWFSQRDGWIKKINPEDGEIQDVFKIEEVYESFDNSGLHAMALHPRFPLVPYVYVNYTYSLYGARLVRYTYSIQAETLVDSVHLIHNIRANFTHNGSRIVFENDSIFYFAIGDGFTSMEVQDPTKLNGKILRMGINGEVPEDNPFPGSYTWSLGHRNPQGLVFGRDGKLYSSEHGEATDDELNLIEKGRNYGWPDVEGFCDLISEQSYCDEYFIREPLVAWTPTEAPCGLGYFDHESIPEWRHSLLQTFLKDKELKALRLSEDGKSILQETDYLSRKDDVGKNIGYYGRLRDVLVAPNGKIYISTSNREPNGGAVVKEDDDKIIELFNPNYSYSSGEDTVLGLESLIHPNPTQDYLNIRFAQELNYTLDLYDRSGKLVKSDRHNSGLNGSFYQFQRGQIEAGMFILVISSREGFKEVHKVIFY